MMSNAFQGQDLASVSPSDFHHLEAKLGLPLAPAFLPRPTRNQIYKPVRNYEDPDEVETNDEETRENQNAEACPSTTRESAGATEAVNQMLAALLMKYIPNLGCVLLAYLSPPVFIFKDSSGKDYTQKVDGASVLPFQTIKGLGWAAINVRVKLLGWRPRIGQKMIGRPTMCSPSHLSLILYQTFNAYIPSSHLILAGYHYDPNTIVPASWKQNGKSSVAVKPKTEVLADMEVEIRDLDLEEAGRGCWVDARGKIVGGDAGIIPFTAISLSITNNMISVTGSVLPDPFAHSTNLPHDTRQTTNVPGRQASVSPDCGSGDVNGDRSAFSSSALSTTEVIGSTNTTVITPPTQFKDRAGAQSLPRDAKTPNSTVEEWASTAAFGLPRPSDSGAPGEKPISVTASGSNQFKRPAVDDLKGQTPKKNKKKAHGY